MYECIKYMRIKKFQFQSFVSPNQRLPVYSFKFEQSVTAINRHRIWFSLNKSEEKVIHLWLTMKNRLAQVNNNRKQTRSTQSNPKNSLIWVYFCFIDKCLHRCQQEKINKSSRPFLSTARRTKSMELKFWLAFSLFLLATGAVEASLITSTSQIEDGTSRSYTLLLLLLLP